MPPGAGVPLQVVSDGGEDVGGDRQRADGFGLGWPEDGRLTHRSRPCSLDSQLAVQFTFSDGTNVTTTSEVLRASESLRVRRTLSEVARPLSRPDVETLTVRQDQIDIERIERSEMDSLRDAESPITAPFLQANERTVWLRLETVTFRKRNKCRFSQGDDEPAFPVRITDPDFLRQIDEGEPFRKNDRLFVVLREQQRLRHGELRTTREVVTVLEHVPAGQQLTMRPIGGGENSESPRPRSTGCGR